jgi:hypothetical protein
MHSKGSSDDFQDRIDLLAPYRSKGQEYLKSTGQQGRVKSAVFNVFAGHLMRAYWERIIAEIRGQESYQDPYELVARHVGKHPDTAKRHRAGETAVNLTTYLSTIHVFRLAWEGLDVPDRRELVIEAMLSALAEIQRLLPPSRRNVESPATVAEQAPALTREEWELLRRAHHSKEWLDASRETDEVRRRRQLLGVAAEIIDDFCNEQNLPSVSAIKAEGLIRLVEQWHRAWTVFFVIVPCRWRF